MKKVMLVGKISAGKTSLCQYLNHQAVDYRKTQAIEIVGDTMIDTPGEYLERRNLYRALVVTAVEAEVILLVQDATDSDSMFAPQMATMFNRPAIGIVTKSDQAQPAQIAQAKEILLAAGAQELFVTSAITGKGCDDLYRYLAPEAQ